MALCLAGMVSAPLAALDVVGLHSARVAVVDRSAAELARGASAALSEVLIKLTGDRKAALGRASPLLKRASKLLVQYAYESRPGAGETTLLAEFDERVLATELDVLDVTIWGKERPDTVVWLIIDSADKRQLVSGDDPGREGEAVLERAASRGVPVLLPLMDIEESQHLVYAGDWDGLAAAAMALSARYATPASLVGHLRQGEAGFWEANWRLHVGNEDYAWKQESDIVELMLDDGVDMLADALARRFAYPRMSAQAEQLALSIYGVNSAADYARLTNYLKDLDTVSDLFVSSIDKQRLEIRLTTRGGRAALAQSILFGRVLAPVADQNDTYQLVP